MLTDKEKRNATGIYIYNQKTFYFLVTGPLPGDVNKLHNMLVGRGLISYGKESTTEYKMMTYQEAEEASHPVEHLFVSPMVKLNWEKDQENKPSARPW